MIDEGFRTLYVDPGEDTGWCQGVGDLLLGAGTTKMGQFAEDVWEAGNYRPGPKPVGYQLPLLHDQFAPWVLEDTDTELLKLPIKRFVVEDWRIYPSHAKQLSWDQCRTARLIGKLELMAEFVYEAEFVLQGAAIKDRAMAGGAGELFYHPLHENRHHNDAIQHFVFYTQTELRGKRRQDILDYWKGETAHHPV